MIEKKPAYEGYAKFIVQIAGVAATAIIAAISAMAGVDTLTAVAIWVNVAVQTASAASVYAVPNLRDARYLKAIVAGILLTCQLVMLIAHGILANELPGELISQFIAGAVAFGGTLGFSNGEIVGSFKDAIIKYVSPSEIATVRPGEAFVLVNDTPGEHSGGA